MIEESDEQLLQMLQQILPPPEQIVTPFEVKTSSPNGIDYDRLVKHFGTSLIEQNLLERFEKLTKQKAHRYLRRGIYYCHRDFEKILDSFERGEKFYLYTGRGPSSKSIHLGHLVPLQFCKYLQDVFDVPVVIQITDDEKLFFKPNLDYSDVQSMANENIKDIIAVGFNPEKTLIFKNGEWMGTLYPTVMKIQSKLQAKQMISVFGFDIDTATVGQFAFPAVQMAPSFAMCFENVFECDVDLNSVNCLIPCAIDQDPYFRVSRDLAPKLHSQKPCLLHSKFLPSLAGIGEKMSASNSESLIFLSDTPPQIKKKIGKCFSGGQVTVAEHREKGGNIETDVAYNLLSVFLEDDELLSHYKNGYIDGSILSGEMKQRAIQTIQNIVSDFQKERNKINDTTIAKFTRFKKIQL